MQHAIPVNIDIPAKQAERLIDRHVKRRPIAIDLFAGIGGFSLGFEQAGFDVAVAVEYDPVHAAVHAYNFPTTKVLCADIRRVSTQEIYDVVQHNQYIYDGFLKSGREIDVVFGGPPCQGFSTIGKRLIDDDRNELVFHFFRVIRDLKPKYFVMENVPGMIAGGHSNILAQLILEFQDAGYKIVPSRILNAANFGVPQDRRRLILLGARKDQPLPLYPDTRVLPVPKRSANVSSLGAIPFEMLADPLPKGPTVWDAIGDLPNLDSFEELLHDDEILLAEDYITHMEFQTSRYVRMLRNIEFEVDDYSYSRTWNRLLLTNSLRTVHTELSVSRFASTIPGETEPISRFYRLDAQGLANTLRAGTSSERGAYTSPRPIHPMLPRVISVREAARLHSFPDWFRLHSTKWHGFRQIGNSVPPLLGKAIASEIRKALQITPVKLNSVLDMGDKSLLNLDMRDAMTLFGVSKDDIPQPRKRMVKSEENG